ncbi:TVP38/TMEM64 family protein [Lawsonibacter celer]|uniref:TVP38/TMEM64 family protein n=1 Tax=Lawsonibacter celer TaxID=2986526 RepID=UPI001647768A|nr:VTT domain-containing protein [Lawsonibacter celer]
MKRLNRLLIFLSAVLLLGGAIVLWRTGFFQAMSSLAAMRDYIDRLAPYSHLAYFLIQLLSVILAPIPSNITALAGAMLFGTWPAFLLTTAAVCAGSMLVFALARVLGRSFADQLVSQTISARYLDVIRRKRDVFLFLAFLFPFFPDDLLCILAGLTDLPSGRFFLMVLLARPWGLLAACALGGSALSLPLWAMLLLGAGGLALFLIVLKYGDKWEAALLARFGK